jgi:hypothetical protein
MKAEDLARRIEEMPIGPFCILLGLNEEHFTEVIADRKKIADALRFFADRYEAVYLNQQSGET